MKQGSLEERVLERSVLKHLKKRNNLIISGADVGSDYSELSVSICDTKSIVASDGCAVLPWAAWTKAVNNFSCSGGEPLGVRIAAILPADMEEQAVRDCMRDFLECSRNSGIYIAGGHTEVDINIKRPRYIVTVLGIRRSDNALCDTCVGDDIVMVGDAGMLGTELLLTMCSEELKRRFSVSYLSGARRSQGDFCISNASELVYGMTDLGVSILHDVSCGGVYAAYGQLAAVTGFGVEVRHDDISVRQETIEFAEFYGINPYMLDGTGALLVVCHEGAVLADRLRSAGMEAAVIGSITEGHDRAVVMNDMEKRYLSLAEGDEIYKVLADM